jgi:hypothetical protein
VFRFRIWHEYVFEQFQDAEDENLAVWLDQDPFKYCTYPKSLEHGSASPLRRPEEGHVSTRTTLRRAWSRNASSQGYFSPKTSKFVKFQSRDNELTAWSHARYDLSHQLNNAPKACLVAFIEAVGSSISAGNIL